VSWDRPRLERRNSDDLSILAFLRTVGILLLGLYRARHVFRERFPGTIRP